MIHLLLDIESLAIFVDFKRAFDHVNHCLLWFKLYKLGVFSKILTLSSSSSSSNANLIDVWIILAIIILLAAARKRHAVVHGGPGPKIIQPGDASSFHRSSFAELVGAVDSVLYSS